MNSLAKPIPTLLCIILAACSGKETHYSNENNPHDISEAAIELTAAIKTNKGTITLKLHEQQTPLTVANFINLAQRGFYDGLTFHRVIDDFMIHGGDPTASGTGTPGYLFKDEFVDDLQHDKPGILSMANAGPNTNGSQFFITHAPTPYLNGRHTIFGEVTNGMDTVLRIETNDTMESITISGDTQKLLESHKIQLTEWNAILNELFPNLKPTEEPTS